MRNAIVQCNVAQLSRVGHLLVRITQAVRESQSQSVGSMTHSSGRPALQWTARESSPTHDQDRKSVVRATCHGPTRGVCCSRLRVDTLGTG